MSSAANTSQHDTIAPHYLDVLNAIQQGAVLIDPVEERIVRVNKVFERDSGFKAEDVMSNPDLLTRRLLRTDIQPQYSVELHYQTPEGLPKFAVWTVSKLTLAEKPLYIAVLCNVSGCIHIQNQNIEAKRLRDELNRERELRMMRENFVTMMSHEFRNTLSVIRFSANFVQRYKEKLTQTQIYEHLSTIENYAQYMVDLLEDVMSVSQANVAMLHCAPTLVDIEEFAKNIIDIFRHNEHQRIITLTCTVDTHQVSLDQRLGYYILVNLISNALKYSSTNTPVRVDIHTTATDIIFRVTDYGIGIPKDERSRIFEPFYRATNSQTYHGTGLGLTIVQNAVKAHEGSVTVESGKQGTTFTVRLPRSIRAVNNGQKVEMPT